MAFPATRSFRASHPLRGCVALSLALIAGLAGAAQAQPVFEGDADGYAGPLIHGAYVGAPFTRVPRPSELVPSAWGYGTYGIPTVAGIRSAPAGIPTVYVIETPPARATRTLAPARRLARPRILSRSRDGRWSRAPEAAPVATAQAGGARVLSEQAGGARVVTVGVPQRQATLR